MKKNLILCGILDRICCLQKNTSFRVICSYSDGFGCSIYTISFFYPSEAKTFGKISFQGETGRVCQFFYKKQRFGNSMYIVDLLLDMYNFEKQVLKLPL